MAKSAKKDPVAVEVSTVSPEMKKYRAEDALRTLTDAEKIRKDKALMRDVESARKAKMAELDAISCEVSPKTIGRTRG